MVRWCLQGLGSVFFSRPANDDQEAMVTSYLSRSNLKIVQYCATKHVNRHVRAAALAFLTTVCDLKASVSISESSNEFIEFSSFYDACTEVLTDSLSDNWSQVRMSGSILCRSFLSCIPDSLRPKVDVALVPKMSLNRFYLAEGVRLYSQGTWKAHVPNGKDVLEKHLARVLKYYMRALDEDNHVVRESAALAIGEAVEKLESEIVSPHLTLLIEGVKAAFYDESWPVRDRACVVLSRIGKRWGVTDEVWDLICSNLTDQIWSVRENAAWGIAQCCLKDRGRVDDAIQRFRKNIGNAKNEPKRSKKDVEREQNDIKLHTNTQLYSCGSLAPKLHKSANRVAGCSDCRVLRPTRVWEISDGCVYLLMHVAAEKLVDDEVVVELIDLAVDACRWEEYVEHESLKTTVLKAFTRIVNTRPKNVFKKYYCNLFIERTVQWCGRGGSGVGLGNLMIFEGETCLKNIMKVLGAPIFWGRVEEVCGSSGMERVQVIIGGGGPSPFGMTMPPQPPSGLRHAPLAQGVKNFQDDAVAVGTAFPKGLPKGLGFDESL